MFSRRYWLFFIIVLAAVGYSMIRFNEVSSPIVSPSDPFKYRHLTLANGLNVLLVHTPDSNIASAAVSVAVGSGDDPKGREGLAHFLEHMLFLGTQPFPEPGEYQAYISRHGGSHNAFTAFSQTTYFFEIDNDSLEGALERFAPFFISPNFDDAYVEREKNAVHAEYTAKIKDDFRRIYSAEKQAMNPDHPFASFTVGTLDTLADREGSKIRDELLDFYDTHYSADRMTLVLAANYDLKQLESWTKSFFNDVPKRDIVVEKNTQPLFLDGHLPLDMTIEPVKEIRRLQFTFPMPETQSLYHVKPVQLLSSLIGHEGEGSLIALLKEKGWAEGLSAGRSLSTENETNLVVQIQLTKDGLLQVDRITQALLHYIDLLTEKPLPKYLLTEQQQLSELMFRFQEHARLSDYTVMLSSNMLLFPTNDIIYGNYRWEPATAKQLKPYLDALSANNMLRTLIAPAVTTDMRDPWYDTPMRIRPLNYQADARFLDDLTALHLPAENPFIPTDFTLYADAEQKTPTLILNDKNRRVWYYPEHEFSFPKSRVIVQLQQEKVQSSGKERLLAQLYSRTVNEALSTYSYPASLAGLDYGLNASARGLELMIEGYQHKLPVLLERILQQMQDIDLSEEHFALYQASLQRMLENQLKNKPYERSLAELRQWLYDPSFSEQTLLQELATITRADVVEFGKQIAQNLSVQIYVHGNFSKDQALKIAALVQDHMPASASPVSLPAIVQAPQGEHQLNLTLDHKDNAFLLYVQANNNSDNARARFSLLGQILSAPYYHRLRTEEQLGYIVFATQYPQQTVPSLVFIVQSPQAKPQAIMESSAKFFHDFETVLNEMGEAEFQAYQKGLITLLLEKPKNMHDKSNRFWQDIEANRADFDTNSAIAAQVEQLTLDDIRTLYQHAIIQRDRPWLVITQGGKLQGVADIKAVNRSNLARFTLPLK